MFGPCLDVHYDVSFLFAIISIGKRESWLLYFLKFYCMYIYHPQGTAEN